MVGACHKQIGANAAQGAAYVFEGSGASWSQTGELTASDGDVGDVFGTSVAVVGTTAVVGRPKKTVTGNENQGAVYVFAGGGDRVVAAGGADGQRRRRVRRLRGLGRARSGDVARRRVGQGGEAGTLGRAPSTCSPGAARDWTQRPTAHGDGRHRRGLLRQVGRAEREHPAVGAYARRSRRGRSSKGPRTSSRVHEADAGWSQQTEAVASDGNENDAFGFSIALVRGHGVVGATGRPRTNEGQGAAYVFWRTTAAPAPDGGARRRRDGRSGRRRGRAGLRRMPGRGRKPHNRRCGALGAPADASSLTPAAAPPQAVDPGGCGCHTPHEHGARGLWTSFGFVLAHILLDGDVVGPGVNYAVRMARSSPREARAVTKTRLHARRSSSQGESGRGRRLLAGGDPFVTPGSASEPARAVSPPSTRARAGRATRAGASRSPASTPRAASAPRPRSFGGVVGAMPPPSSDFHPLANGIDWTVGAPRPNTAAPVTGTPALVNPAYPASSPNETLYVGSNTTRGKNFFALDNLGSTRPPRGASPPTAGSTERGSASTGRTRSTPRTPRDALCSALLAAARHPLELRGLGRSVGGRHRTEATARRSRRRGGTPARTPSSSPTARGSSTRSRCRRRHRHRRRNQTGRQPEHGHRSSSL